MRGRPRKAHRVVGGVETKECPLCERWIPLGGFHRHNGSWDRRQGICIQCKRSRRKPAPRIYTIRKYGITETQYQQLLDSQGGACAICLCPSPTGQGAWHIDHDHSCCPGAGSCGACVRGLLCNKCNAGLGYFKDDPARLLSAVNYLKRGARNV